MIPAPRWLSGGQTGPALSVVVTLVFAAGHARWCWMSKHQESPVVGFAEVDDCYQT